MSDEIIFPELTEEEKRAREEWNSLSPYQQFKRIGEDKEGHGMSDYLQAEYVAVHRAIYVLKQLEPGQTITYCDLMKRAVEYANQFPGIGAKYRDVGPRIEVLADYGIIEFSGNPEDWENVTVRLTPKGFLSRPEEWYKDTYTPNPIPEFLTEYMPYNYYPDERDPALDEAFIRELERM